jgi:hypothetical protein
MLCRYGMSCRFKDTERCQLIHILNPPNLANQEENVRNRECKFGETCRRINQGCPFTHSNIQLHNLNPNPLPRPPQHNLDPRPVMIHPNAYPRMRPPHHNPDPRPVMIHTNANPRPRPPHHDQNPRHHNENPNPNPQPGPPYANAPNVLPQPNPNPRQPHPRP